METQQDFRDLLALFNYHKIDFLVVGGYALAFHGAPRFTGDINILINTKPINDHRVLDALDSFGFGSLDLNVSDFSTPNNVQLGVPPVRIDLLTSITGVAWDDTYAN